eukprot:scaffold137398_cov39-Tisochrysis_lutea.AAC.3
MLVTMLAMMRLPHQIAHGIEAQSWHARSCETTHARQPLRRGKMRGQRLLAMQLLKLCAMASGMVSWTATGNRSATTAARNGERHRAIQIDACSAQRAHPHPRSTEGARSHVSAGVPLSLRARTQRSCTLRRSARHAAKMAPIGSLGRDCAPQMRLESRYDYPRQRPGAIQHARVRPRQSKPPSDAEQSWPPPQPVSRDGGASLLRVSSVRVPH